MRFGEVIKYLRDWKDWKISELSRVSGVPASYISNLESGNKNNPSVAILNKLAKALSLTDDELAMIMQAIDQGKTLEQFVDEFHESRRIFIDDEHGEAMQHLCLKPITSLLLRNANNLTYDDFMLISSSLEHLITYLANRNRNDQSEG